MRRIADLLLRNWQLRLGAILLASVLYTGLVLGQNVRTWQGEVPIERIRQPANVTLLADLPPVKSISYRAPIDVLLSPSLFAATVDLSRVTAQTGGPPVAVPVTLVALDSRIQIVDFNPREVQVQLDPVAERALPVTVTLGTVPDGVTVGPPQTDPATVTLRGASSRVNAVSEVVARVSIDASALNVDSDIELAAVDGNGNQVPNVEIDPARARVRIAVARELANRTLPVVPILTGQPAFGYRVSAITVEPLVVTVSGEAATVSSLDSAPTVPISVDGRTTDLEATIGLSLPQGVSVSGSDQVKVTLTMEREAGTRTFLAAVRFSGQTTGLTYSTSTDQVEVVLAGPLDLLAAVNPTTLIATADVSGMAPGSQSISLTLSPPAELQLVSMTPAQITVSIAASSSPSP